MYTESEEINSIQEPEENYTTGWIKIFRSIKNHWIWQDPIKFQWWIDILLTVNHSGKKINIGFTIIECNPGQTVKSLFTWAKEWNVSKDTVRNFFTLLKKDKMILTENLKKTTRITVCNYDVYQTNLHVKQTTSKRQANDKQTTSDPNKNDKNDKKYIYNEFFDNEISKLNGTDKLTESYKKYVAFMFGDNKTETALDGVLKLSKQLTYKEFSNLLNITDAENIYLKLYSIQNNRAYQKKYDSVYLTVLNWIKRDKK